MTTEKKVNKRENDISIMSLGHSRYIITAYSEVINFLKSIHAEVNHLGISPDLWYSPKDHRCAQAYKAFDFDFYFLPRESGRKTSYMHTPDIKKELNKSFPVIAYFIAKVVNEFKPDVFIIGDDWGVLEIFIMQYFNWQKIPVVFIEHGPAIFNSQLMNDIQIRARKQQSWSKKKYHLPIINPPGFNGEYLICSYSEPAREMTIKIGADHGHFRNTGFPYFDKIYREKENFLKSKENIRNKILIISNGNGSFGGNYAKSAINYYKFLYELIRCLHIQYDISLRLKPGENLEDFLPPEILQKFRGLTFVFDDNTEESYKAIQKYNLIIGETSTLLLEALIVGIPAILINLPNDILTKTLKVGHHSFFQDIIGVLTITNSTEVMEKVNLAFSDHDYLIRCSDKLKENERYFFYKLDGRISERVALVLYESIIRNLIEKNCIEEAHDLFDLVKQNFINTIELFGTTIPIKRNKKKQFFWWR